MEKGIKRNVKEEWAKLSEQQKKEYRLKVIQNHKKRKALMKKYKQTKNYKKEHQEYQEWKESVAKFYPPQPLMTTVWCFHFIGIILHVLSDSVPSVFRFIRFP